jgi:hypothetical protein
MRASVGCQWSFGGRWRAGAWLWALAVFLVLAAPARAAAKQTSPGQRAAQQPNALTESHAARPPEELVLEGNVLGKRVPARPGEICLVCNKLIGRDDVAYLVRGQRVALHVPVCLEKFVQRPQFYLAILQPRGAFLGTSGQEGGLAWGWFFAGLYVLLGLVFAALCAHRALHAGHSPALWFGLGLALNVVAYLLLLTRPKKETGAPGGVPKGLAKVAATYAPQQCPRCGLANHPSAEECAGCGRKLHPAMKSEVSRAGLRSN